MPLLHNLRRAGMTMAAAAAVLAPAAPATAAVRPVCPGAYAQPAADNLPTIGRATLCLLNRERVRYGLARLRSNDPLQKVASRYARSMSANRFFDHVSPTGSTFVERIMGSSYVDPGDGYSLGENIAWGSGELSTPSRIVRAWMLSPGHRANILNGRYRDIGVGVATGVPVPGGGPGATYVNEFGTRS